MTEASIRALGDLRDFSTLQWYVIPLLAVVLSLHAVEMRKARAGRNRDAVPVAMSIIGMGIPGWVD